MPSLVRSSSSKPHRYQPSSKDKFRTVLGLGPVFKHPNPTVPHPHPGGHNSAYSRKSIDTPRSYKAKRKHKVERASVTDRSFFGLTAETTGVISNEDHETSESFIVIDNMKRFEANNSRRPPVRMDAQDGPWSVSVAETPYDAQSFSLYIKSE
jgi:serum/glucocorticoid-regulated kinase 2